MLDDGVRFDAPFATLTLRNRYECNSVRQEVVRFTARTFNVFTRQVGDAVENAFGGTGTFKTGDLQMTVVRHEVCQCARDTEPSNRSPPAGACAVRVHCELRLYPPGAL